MPTEFHIDTEYFRWLEAHPYGFVVNTRHPASPDYMVLHRATCTFISKQLHEVSPGGFTERGFIKIASDDVDALRDWVAAHGRQDGTFSKECAHCRPTSRSDPGHRTATHKAPLQSPPLLTTPPRVAADNAIESSSGDMQWQLWRAGAIQRQIEAITPLLASWEKSSHPAQIRLREYLGTVVSQLMPLPEDVPLFLQLGIDVEDSAKLLRHYDLENYLTPLFGSHWLPSSRFVFVTAKKYVGGGSRIAWGLATREGPTDEDGWSHFSMNAGRGASHSAWKERIRSGLASSSPAPLPSGPAQVRLAWRCSDKRNWCSFWKPTGDAMGPVLGFPNPQRPYHLNDDRIVDLELHRNVDNQLSHDVIVGMWWRAAG